MLAALELLRSPLVRALIGLVAVILIASGAYWKGRSDCAALDRSASLTAQVEQLKADIKARERVASEAAQAVQKLNDEKAEDDERIAAYEEELARRPGPGCILSPDDARRLRDITGGDRPAPRPPAPPARAG